MHGAPAAARPRPAAVRPLPGGATGPHASGLEARRRPRTTRRLPAGAPRTSAPRPRRFAGTAAATALLAPLLLLLVPSDAHAEPHLAVRYGYKCSQCHLNPTGGGKRNRFGNIFSQTELPRTIVSGADVARLLRLGEVAPESGGPPEDGPSTFFSGYLTDFLSAGGDFRFNATGVFRAEEGTSANTFDITEGNLYASVELFEETLAFYVDESVAPGGASAREVFGLVRGPWSSYLKLGRMLLPFGLRLQDDTAFIRELTGFNFGVQDLGIEAGLEPGPLSLSLAVSNGSQSSADDNKDKQITAMASFIRRYWRLGGQASFNNASTAKRMALGGFAGLNLGMIDAGGIDFGKWTLLGEIDHVIDVLETVPGEPYRRQLLLYGAVHYQLFKGVDLRFSYDFADPDTSAPEDAFTRASFGVQYTVTQFLELRAFYRYRDDTEDSIRDDESVVDLEVHLFF